MSALVRARGTRLWLALYAVGLVCVLSFVFFEVLDVDGSDFERIPSKVAIKVAETPHEALKRGALGHGGPPVAPPLVAFVTDPPRPAATLAGGRQRPVPARSVSSAGAALPRSRLSDVPPSA